MKSTVTPFSLKDAPALIERLLPVQKLSAEAFKEQMAVHGKTLTALGSYWKGRKPLILNKACILGCLLPATANPSRDLKTFEQLMAMDDESFVIRWKRRPKPKELLASLPFQTITDYFDVDPPHILPMSSPIDWSRPDFEAVKVKWRADITELTRRQYESRLLPMTSYRSRVEEAQRPEEVADTVHEHIWDGVNSHLGTTARSIPELTEQLGLMRFGHRPRVADAFSGSGQIPFEAARLGCDVFASDLNPVACMLTWGALHIVGGSNQHRQALAAEQLKLASTVREEIAKLGIETDGAGWNAKVYLYCVEALCPQSGWTVPLLPSRIVSTKRNAIVELEPDAANKRYNIHIREGVSDIELKSAATGTVSRDGKYGEAYLHHQVAGIHYKTKMSTLRGDYERPDGTIANRLRLWEKHDFRPRPDDILQERLYCVQWTKPKSKGKGVEYAFRTVTADDMVRERVVNDFVSRHLSDWQAKGWLPDMRIEVGGPPRYQGLDLVRARGWTHWHHLFTPRQLLVGALMQRERTGATSVAFCQSLNRFSRLSRWNPAAGNTEDVFYNQALNTLYNYGTRSSERFIEYFLEGPKSFPLTTSTQVVASAADQVSWFADVWVTDPPYGDAVKYEEIYDYFIAWIRRNPPREFADWVWDSRRSLAIQGEDESFRQKMVAAYRRMAEQMPENGMQVVMFTHQDGPIWADMANIVWASGLQVTAAWYVATETESILRAGNNVKGTVLLVCRKRGGTYKTTRDDLAWELQEEVELQVRALTGLNQESKGLYRDENVFEDADIQMAGYAAALRVLTRYATIDGRNMSAEAIRPRIKGETTFVDNLIAFAVDTANQCLVPQGIAKSHWDGLSGAERFYLKLLDTEAKRINSLDNYQNFAKAFKVRDFRTLMASQKANEARLKSAVEFGKAEMSEGSELYQSVLRAVLFGIMELARNIDGAVVLAHLTLNVPDYYSNQKQRELVVELAGYLAKHLETLRPDEASNARVLRDLVQNQRIG